MLKLLTAAQTQLADKYTIENLAISSWELMERACNAFVTTFLSKFTERKKTISVFCGKGNNGGDGLAIARMLIGEGFTQTKVFIADFEKNETPNFKQNLERLQSLDADISYLSKADDLETPQVDFIIDALFGYGLNRALTGEWPNLIEKINNFSAYKIAVDIPSGLPAEGEPFNNKIICADWVISFQRPKLNFLLPLSNSFIKKWKVVNIGLDENYIQSIATPYFWFWKGDVQNWLKPRKAFTHKGLLGHALIIAGNTQTMGAALICTEACIKTGAGLTTAMVNSSALVALNTRIPEAMFVSRDDETINFGKYTVIAIGPGLGINNEATALLKSVLKTAQKPLVLDADALNILSENPEFINLIPKNSVLTPHIKEFDRLFGTHQTCWQRIETAFKQAKKLQVYIVLKNRYTMIFNPNGACYFNSSGSPAMANGGMGDALTGIITSTIAQGYEIEKAVLIAVFTHGYVGEQLAKKMFSVTATAVIKQIPYALKELAGD
ncbi:MAG: NAD(P)H-hydrate dehydratase [Sphingobacteriales bacterium]|nr:MAG: NAD(P)H-hydrate dehydratase [Sphingobacteriales bacterium]